MTLTKGDFGPPFLFCGLNGMLWKTGLGEVVGRQCSASRAWPL